MNLKRKRSIKTSNLHGFFFTHILWHSQHSKGCSPVCIRWFSLWRAPPSSHLYLRSPACTRRCLFRYNFVVNARSHSLHLWGLHFCLRSASFAIVNSCTLKFSKGRKQFRSFYPIDLSDFNLHSFADIGWALKCSISKYLNWNLQINLKNQSFSGIS